MCTCKNAVKGRQNYMLQTLLFVLIKLFYTPDFVLLEELFVMLLSFIPLFFRSCVFVYVTVDWVNLREYHECSPHSLMWYQSATAAFTDFTHPEFLHGTQDSPPMKDPLHNCYLITASLKNVLQTRCRGMLLA